MTNDEEPQWRQARDLPNFLVCGDGKIYNKERDKIARPWVGPGGFYQVDVSHGGDRKIAYVHRLVYSSFHSYFDPRWQVFHIDLDKSNNSINNLNAIRFDETLPTNREITYRIGGNAVYCPELDMAFGNAYQAAEYIGGDPDNIRKCLIGERSHHRGFSFRYL